MAAPLGNQNACKTKVWAAALQRALERRIPANERIKAIDELADVLVGKAYGGDMSALQELANRLDGKPAQSLTVGTDPEQPFEIQRRVTFVRNTNP